MIIVDTNLSVNEEKNDEVIKQAKKLINFHNP